MLTNKEGFNIPLMHSCVNWTATNPLCTKSREMNPTVHQFSVSRKKNPQHQKKLKETHRWLAHIKQRDSSPYQSAEKKQQYSSVLYKQENKANCSNSAVQARSRRAHISPDPYKPRRRIKHTVQMCHCLADEGRQQ